jgi:hypothetical protein
LDKRTYQSKEEIVQDIKPSEFLQQDHDIVKEYIYSEKFVIKIKNYFITKGIPYEDLFYEDIPQYISDNFPNTKSFHVETGYDYKTLITNYTDIDKLYNYYLNHED